MSRQEGARALKRKGWANGSSNTSYCNENTKGKEPEGLMLLEGCLRAISTEGYRDHRDLTKPVTSVRKGSKPKGSLKGL